MRLLALSDIHHNLAAVRKLRAAEANGFDAIVVAGDIGNESADAFFAILASFECPVLYVFGNWDQKLSYRKSYGGNFHLLQARVIELGGFYFTGFSGCPTNWGQNPIARRILPSARDSAELRQARGEVLELNRQALRKAVRRAAADPRRTVVVTHERLPHLAEHLPGTLLHLHGHLHRFSDQVHKGTRVIDVAALDRRMVARPRRKRKWTTADCRLLNGGNYVKIEIDAAGRIVADCVYLRRDYPEWLPVDDFTTEPAEWIAEEQSFAESR